MKTQVCKRAQYQKNAGLREFSGRPACLQPARKIGTEAGANFRTVYFSALSIKPAKSSGSGLDQSNFRLQSSKESLAECKA